MVPEHLEGFTPEYCQAVFEYFEQHATETATLPDRRASISAQHRSDEDETDSAVSLHQARLPKLADAGLIDYDPQRKTARFGRSDKNSWSLSQ